MAKEIKKHKNYKFSFFIERYFKFIAPALFAAVLALGYFLVIGNQLNLYAKLKNIDLPNAYSENQRLIESKLYYLKVAKQVYVNPDEERYLSMAVPDDFYFTSIANQLTSLAKSYGFNVLAIKADKANTTAELAAPTNSLRTVKISLSISGGDYGRLKAFLSGIEKSAMIFDVQSISFGSANSFNMEMTAYYFN